ncbi:MAG: DsbA family protein [Candidatus Eremiobacteraeota bacterium]|nr:DsbA family protein [Candidatus Eremiobacteraeota bacterium]
MTQLKLIYYVDVLSSWCFVAEPALARLREELGERLDYEWRIAYLFGGGPMGYSAQLSAWQYERNKSVSGFTLNPAWRETLEDTTWFADLAAEAARALGITDDRVRLALTRAAFVDAKHIGRRDEAVRVAAEAGGLTASALESAMDDAAVIERMQATTAEYKALGVKVLPAFVMTNAIGDTAILSGLFRYETMASCAAEMLAAADGYAAFERAHPQPA